MINTKWQPCPVLGYDNYEIIGKYSDLSDKNFENLIEPMYLNAGTTRQMKWGYMNYTKATLWQTCLVPFFTKRIICILINIRRNYSE